MTPFEQLADLYGEDIAAAQLELEAEGFRLGEARFLAAMDAKAALGQGADTQVARPLMAELVPPVAAELVKFLESQNTGRAGKKASAFRFVRTLDPEVFAFITLRTTMNMLAKEVTDMASLARAIGYELESEQRYARMREQDHSQYRHFVEPQVRKRSGDHFKRGVLRAAEIARQTEGHIDPWESWGETNSIHVGIKAVEFLINVGLLKLEDTTGAEDWSKARKGYKEVTSVQLTQDAAEWLRDRKDFLKGCSPVWQPMVVPPKPWTALNRGGYWGRGRTYPKFIKALSKRGRKRYEDVDLDRVFQAVNAIQETPWMVNSKVLKVAQAIAEWRNPVVQDFPSSELTPMPDRVEGMDEDAKVLKGWKREAAKAYRKEKARRSRRLAVESVLEQAQKMSQHERIWFPYNVDFRSRIYAIPSFSPQGTDLAKGLLLLADPVPMGADGEYWMRMHIANTAGLDKEPMDVRQQWTHDNEDLILDTSANPLDNLWWATDSDSPFCFLAACFEYAAWKASQNPQAYLCGLPIAFDGSCSGIQHFSAMLRDSEGGRAVNLIPADKPSDIYKIVCDRVALIVEKDLTYGAEGRHEAVVDEETGEITERYIPGEKDVAQAWVKYGLTRKVTKRSVMTLPYGSEKFGFTDQLLEDIIKPANEKDSTAFPHPQAAASYLAGHIWDVLGETVVAAVQAMKWLQKAASALASQDMPATWVTPAGFPVWHHYLQPNTKTVDTMICGTIRLRMNVQLNEEGTPEEERKILRHKQVNAISPNFVHSMDASHMMLTALACFNAGIRHFAMIHDSFGTCPGNAGTMFRVVRETMVNTYLENDVIRGFYEGFCDSLTDKSSEKIPALPGRGDLDLLGILESKYCFC